MVLTMLCISVAFILAYIFSESLHRPLLSFGLKALASFSFILLAIISIFSFQTDLAVDSTTTIIIGLCFMAGLVAGLIGDLTLALRPLRPKEEDKKIIVMGIIPFAIGHLFYLAGLLLQGDLSWVAIVLPIAMTSLIVIMSIKLKYEMGIARYPTYVYATLIFMMVGQAIGLAFLLSFNMYSLLLLIGAILFAVSDLLLAPIYFSGNKSYYLVALNLLTYYGAQVLIAYSLCFL